MDINPWWKSLQGEGCVSMVKSIDHYQIPDRYRQLFLASGVGINDYLEVIPLYGKKQKIQLNRTCYYFYFKKINRAYQEHFNIYLPSLQEDDGPTLELRLIPFEGHNSLEQGRYLLQGIGQELFVINGNMTNHAYLQKKDQLDCKYNQMHFLPSEKYEDSEDLAIDQRIVSSDLLVLLEGETGTGKSYLAKKIHQGSGRTGKFVHLNLSSFSSGLIESELFGHRKGAFTGAMADKIGAIKDANLGTLFLDEIDSLPWELQTKLLLFFDNRQIRPVGDNRQITVDTRIIVAAGRELGPLVEQQQLRKDFFYRITSGHCQKLLPLRGNPLLLKQHLQKFERDNKVIISESLANFYQTRIWPGNLRQLYSHLHKKKVLSSGGKLVIDNLDLLIDKEGINEVLQINLQQIPYLDTLKRDYAYWVYLKTEKNIKEVSKLLNISENTVRKLVKDAS